MTDAELAKQNMAAHAINMAKKAKETSDELTAAIGALCGAMMNKTGMDDVSFTDDTDTVFMDPRNDSMDVSTMESIQMKDGVLVVFDDRNPEPTELADLMLGTRIDLANKLAKMLLS